MGGRDAERRLLTLFSFCGFVVSKKFCFLGFFFKVGTHGRKTIFRILQTKTCSILLGNTGLYSKGVKRHQPPTLHKLWYRLRFTWTITKNSMITMYISRTNLRRKAGIWFLPDRGLEQLWWTELPFKQRFFIDRSSGSETVRKMCSVRIMWHQSFCFNHNTCLAVTHTAPPRTSRHQLPKQRQLFPSSLTTPAVHNKQDIH